MLCFATQYESQLRNHLSHMFCSESSFLGSGPGRGQSPVEWGDFPSVHPYVHPSVHLLLGGPETRLVFAASVPALKPAS